MVKDKPKPTTKDHYRVVEWKSPDSQIVHCLNLAQACKLAKVPARGNARKALNALINHGVAYLGDNVAVY